MPPDPPRGDCATHGPTAAPTFKSYLRSADRTNIEESSGNFFLYSNCKLLGTTIGRKLTARQRDSFIEWYAVDASYNKSKPRQECLEELSRLKEVCLY